VEVQQLLISLLSEYSINPLMYIMQMTAHGDRKKLLPPSTHWYIEKDTDKRVKTVDWGNT